VKVVWWCCAIWLCKVVAVLVWWWVFFVCWSNHDGDGESASLSVVSMGAMWASRCEGGVVVSERRGGLLRWLCKVLTV
jgi:hypothetical protein